MSDQMIEEVSCADEDYLNLVKRCPLRPIRSEAEHARAIEMLNWLIDKGVAGHRTFSEEDFMDVLGDLVESYEDERYPSPSDSQR